MTTNLSSQNDNVVAISGAAAFEEFWRSFPRRIGKGAARKEFEKALKLVDAATLVQGAKRYAAWCATTGREPEYICHPRTWLHQERWDDELEFDPGRKDWAHLDR
jgi:hypothetical protein